MKTWRAALKPISTKPRPRGWLRMARRTRRVSGPGRAPRCIRNFVRARGLAPGVLGASAGRLRRGRLGADGQVGDVCSKKAAACG
eukprot:6700086-Alexandrium_andersonii.AAC.1